MAVVTKVTSGLIVVTVQGMRGIIPGSVGTGVKVGDRLAFASSTSRAMARSSSRPALALGEPAPPGTTPVRVVVILVLPNLCQTTCTRHRIGEFQAGTRVQIEGDRDPVSSRAHVTSSS